MSRTFLITQPTALATALQDAGLTDITERQMLDQEQPDTTSVDTCFDFIERLASVPHARRYVMWSVANSLNNSIIGQLQSHLRREAFDEQDEVNRSVEYNNEQMDQATLDKYNEQRAAVDAMIAEQEARVDQGFEAITPPIDIAEILVNLRAWLAGRMEFMAKSRYELAQPISESIAFRLKDAPKADEKKVMQLHILTKLPLDVLRKADLKVKVTERDVLVKNMHRIIELSEELVEKAPVTDEQVEQNFDALPVHVQYRLIGAVIRSLKGAMDAEVKALIRFGRTDAVTNRLIIEQVLEGYKALLGEFTSTHADALYEYEQRGFPLPTLEQLLADKEG